MTPEDLQQEKFWEDILVGVWMRCGVPQALCSVLSLVGCISIPWKYCISILVSTDITCPLFLVHVFPNFCGFFMLECSQEIMAASAKNGQACVGFIFCVSF